MSRSLEYVVAARRAPGCRDFSVSVDSVDERRVNVYEEWESLTDLEAFRGEGGDDRLMSLVAHAEVAQYEVPQPSPD